jgi:hypothetical protein
MQTLNLTNTSFQALNSLISEPQEQSKTAKARAILGDTSSQYTDEQLECLVADFEHLADTWLDDFERQIFEGKTLQELLKTT